MKTHLRPALIGQKNTAVSLRFDSSKGREDPMGEEWVAKVHQVCKCVKHFSQKSVKYILVLLHVTEFNDLF
jgi:hypothetical protein